MCAHDRRHSRAGTTPGAAARGVTRGAHLRPIQRYYPAAPQKTAESEKERGTREEMGRVGACVGGGKALPHVARGARRAGVWWWRRWWCRRRARDGAATAEAAARRARRPARGLRRRSSSHARGARNARGARRRRADGAGRRGARADGVLDAPLRAVGLSKPAGAWRGRLRPLRELYVARPVARLGHPAVVLHAARRGAHQGGGSVPRRRAQAGHGEAGRNQGQARRDGGVRESERPSAHPARALPAGRG